MTESELNAHWRRRANWTFAAFMGVGFAVFVVVSVLTGNLSLGLLYGLLPGVALGLLGRFRLIRGGLVNRESRKPDTGDRDAT